MKGIKNIKDRDNNPTLTLEILQVEKRNKNMQKKKIKQMCINRDEEEEATEMKNEQRSGDLFVFIIIILC